MCFCGHTYVEGGNEMSAYTYWPGLLTGSDFLESCPLHIAILVVVFVFSSIALSLTFVNSNCRTTEKSGSDSNVKVLF